MTLPVALSLVLAVLAAAHAWWALGGIWPAASEPEFLGLGLERGPVKSLPSQNRPASS